MERPIDVLFTREVIEARTVELAREIDRDFPDGDMVVIGALKGAFIFMADLVRHIKRPLSCDFIRISSYEHDKNSGVVRMDFDVTQPVSGKNVLLVEDIVDSGRTLRYLLKHLHASNPANLKVATLLYKEMNTGSRELIDYVGFECPDRFVLGYGLDSEGLYRSLPFVGAYK